MTTFDFTPFFRSTVGFDRLARRLEDSLRWSEQGNGYPPYNIEKAGDDRYRITLAVAGFGEDELAVDVHDNTLVVEGNKGDGEKAEPGSYLFRGIATRAFKRQFQLAEHVEVAGAHLTNGLLVVELVRRVPEEMKPRRIAIQSAPAADSKAEIEDKKAA